MPILQRETSIFPEALLNGFTAGDQDRQWWAAYTKARQEKALARQLLRHQVPFYLPLVPRPQIIRGRRMVSYVPLFDGYVFVFGSHAERDVAWTTNRLSRVVPVPDGEELCGDLRNVNRLIESNAPLTVESRLSPGQRVRIKRGCFKDIEGAILRRQGKYRLVVVVNFLQQGASVEIDDAMLEPV